MRKCLLLLLIIILFCSGCNKMHKDEFQPQASPNDETKPSIIQSTPQPEVAQPLENFNFRGFKFWDPIEDVIEKEGEPDSHINHDDEGYSSMIIYECVDILGYDSELTYAFLYEKLYDIHVEVQITGDNLIEEMYYDIKHRMMDSYGEPTSDDEAMGDGIITFWMNNEQKYVTSIYYDDERLSFGMRAFRY